MTIQELVNYYANLLILQYLGLPRAYATIQTLATPAVLPQTTVQEISFSGIAASGTFVLSYDGVLSAAINWNDSVATIQTKIRAITGLSTVTVSGSIASETLVVTFTGVAPVALPLVINSNTLMTSAPAAISLTVTETDMSLPIAVQNAFNLIAPNLAQGVQLDVLGKYAGVTRTGNLPSGQVTLDDTDFYTLIQLAIIQNSAGSSLSDIQDLLHQFFPDQVLVFDYKDMRMSYLVSTAIGSFELVELAIVNNLLPKPMAVQLAVVIYAPIINKFFGFRTYQLPGFNIEPFNTYTTYHMDWPWLSYADAIVI